MPRLSAAVLVVTLASTTLATRPAAQTTDLDSFMRDVVARRDDNWRKLQQYILEEREELALNLSGHRLWGEQRDYSWFIRDGFFVRSPVKFNGAAIGEGERRKAEDEYLRRAQRRDARGRQSEPAASGDGEAPTNVDSLIRQTRQPQFVSSSYFLRFKFDEGRYALAGREKFEGRDVLKIEYYPTKLYSEDRRGRRGGLHVEDGRDRESDEIRRLMNKVAIVTIWVEPASRQIVKYTFDNVDFDFMN